MSVSAPKKTTGKKYDEKVIVAKSLIMNRDLRVNISLVLKNTMIIPFKFANNSQFSCQYCDGTYLLFKDLKNHVKVRHIEITEKQIERTIISPKELVKADVSNLSCRLCGSNYNTIEKLVEHLKVLHSIVCKQIPGLKYSHGILGFDLSGSKPKCYICAKDFAFFKNLSSHMNEHDTDYICHVCGKRFVAEHRLILHVGRHKPTDFQCNHCDKKFRSASGKSLHMRNKHKNPQDFKCPQCYEVFTLYAHRMKHMIEKHKYKKPEFRCPHCSENFTHPSARAKHIRGRHFKEENMKYVCDICDKVFHNKWILDRHIGVHTGRKNFVCQYCSKQFAKKYTLKMHEKTHLAEKDYPCTLCDAAFVQKCSLKIHMKKKHPWSLVQVD